jgi:hypothetical protein
MGKKANVAVAVVVVVVLTAAVAVLVGLFVARRSYDAPELQKAVLQKARETMGVSLDSSRSRFGLFDGLVLEGVTASSDLAGGRYQVRIDAVRLEHRPQSLLSGRLELTRLVLERPRVAVELGAPVPRAAPATVVPSSPSPSTRKAGEETESAGSGGSRTSRESSRVVLIPKELVVEGGSIAIRDEKRDREILALDGLHLELPSLVYDRRAITPLHALASKGELAVSSLAVEGLRVTRLTASLSTAGGRFRFDAARFHADAGDFEGDLDVDFNSIPFRYRASLEGMSVDLGRLAGTPSGGSGTAGTGGTSRVRLEAEGFGTESRNLRATGTLELRDGRLPALAWLSAIDPSLPGADYGSTTVSFEIRDRRLSFDGLRLGIASSRSELVLSGSIGFDDDADVTIRHRVDEDETSYRLRGKLDEPELSRLPGSGASRSAPPAVRREK